MKRAKNWGLWLCILMLIFLVNWLTSGRPHFRGFEEAKRVMAQKVAHDYPVTIYCQAGFDAEKKLELPPGFVPRNGREEARRMNWEHAVPVAKFGRTFREWREGHSECRQNGRAYKGRKCAALVNAEFQRLEGDMYNLFPAIDAVNAARGSREYAELPKASPVFGSCGVKLGARVMEPPSVAKGAVARASLYMAKEYPEHVGWSKRQEQLFEKWNRLYPVQEWECVRTKRIERLQGNTNNFVKEPCKAKGWW